MIQSYQRFNSRRLRVRKYSKSSSCLNFFGQNIKRVLALSLLLSLRIYASSSDQNSQLIKLAVNKRIEAPICADSMNRISVANDRITQIFGDEGTFESQNDDATGQIFLKPTAENGSKNLSLTLITEQGITQDLTLIPTSKSPKTLILSRDPNYMSFNNNSLEFNHSPYYNKPLYNPNTFTSSHKPKLGYANALPIQDQLLEVLKQAINGQLPMSVDASSSHDHSHIEGISLTPSHSWKAGPYVVEAILIENTSDTSINLQEKDFYQGGDLALSIDARDMDSREKDRDTFQARVLPPQGQATLYIVRHEKANLP